MGNGAREAAVNAGLALLMLASLGGLHVEAEPTARLRPERRRLGVGSRAPGGESGTIEPGRIMSVDISTIDLSPEIARDTAEAAAVELICPTPLLLTPSQFAGLCKTKAPGNPARAKKRLAQKRQRDARRRQR